MLAWMRATAWEADTSAREPIPYKTKVPEFYSGVRLFGMGGGGAQGGLELFIKKLQYGGVIGKQELYPVGGHGAARTLSLKKADLDNLGVGGDVEEDDE